MSIHYTLITMLSDILGKNPEIKIIDFFLLHEDYAYTKKEIAECSGISRASVYAKLPKLLKDGILIETKKIGKISLYKINLQNETVAKIRELYYQIASIKAEREERKAKEIQTKDAIEVPT